MEIINANEKKCQICGKHLKICDWTICFLSLSLSLWEKEWFIRACLIQRDDEVNLRATRISIFYGG